jgi:hypothetical protein
MSSCSRLINLRRIRLALDEILEARAGKMDDVSFAHSKFLRAAELFLKFADGPFRPFLTTELYAELI